MEIVGQIKLGNRERQVLFWTSQGKTSFEISKILDLSEHTINNYITNAANKLGTNNRVHDRLQGGVVGTDLMPVAVNRDHLTKFL